MNYKYEIYRMPIGVIMEKLASDCRKRRLEKGLSRKSLADLSGVPAASIERFETKHKIALESYALLADALDYTDELLSVMSKPKFSTMNELETINKNKNRQRGK